MGDGDGAEDDGYVDPSKGVPVKTETKAYSERVIESERTIEHAERPSKPAKSDDDD